MAQRSRVRLIVAILMSVPLGVEIVIAAPARGVKPDAGQEGQPR